MTKTIKTMLAILLAVPVLAFGVVALAPAQTANAQAACPENGIGTISQGAQCAKGAETPPTLFGDGGIFTTIVNILLFIIGAISVIMLIIGGIRYTISGGDSSAVTSAKNTIMYAIVGIIVAVLAFAIVNFVLKGLTGVGA